MSMLQTLAWFSNVQPKPPVVAAAPYHSSTRRAWLHHILAGFQKGNAWMIKDVQAAMQHQPFGTMQNNIYALKRTDFILFIRSPTPKSAAMQHIQKAQGT